MRSNALRLVATFRSSPDYIYNKIQNYGIAQQKNQITATESTTIIAVNVDVNIVNAIDPAIDAGSDTGKNMPS